MSIELTYFLIFNLVFLIHAVVGTLIIKLTFPKNTLNSTELLFAKLLISTVLFASFTAIFKSGGITLLWFLLIACISLFVALGGKKLSKPILTCKKLKKQEIVTGFLFWSLGMIWFTWQLITAKGFHLHSTEIPHKDIVFYADVSQNLMIHGQENSFLYGNMWFPELNGIVPYHYFELWLNGMYSQISGHHLQTFQLITQSWFLLLTSMGFASVFSRIHQNSHIIQVFLSGIFGLFIVGLSGTLLFGNDGMWQYTEALVFNPAMVIFQKAGVLFPFFLSAWLCYMHKSFPSALIILLMLPVASVATAPAILPASFLIVLWLLFMRKINKVMAIKLIIYIVFFFLTLFFLLSYFGSPVLQNMGLSISDSLKHYDKTYWANTFYLTQTIPCIHLFAVAPFLIIFIFTQLKFIKVLHLKLPLFPVVFILWISAFTAWLLLRFHGYDAIQFFSIPAGILVCLTCYGLLISTLKNKSIMLSILILFGGIGSIQAYQHNLNRNVNIKYSESYCSKIHELNNQLGNPNKAFILAESAYIEESDFVPYFKRAAWFLSLDKNPDVLVSIGTEHLPDNLEEWNLFKRTNWQTSVFGMHSKKLMLQNPEISWDDCQRAFVTTYQIKMIFLGRGAKKPGWLYEMEDFSISDEESGETCVFLKLTNIEP